ncbi:hypothetical protein GOBAR_AA02332 [Gossypium barbadense]|uniref:Protein kinase domain-containing protein n=1 Tax=Gossypium barbadense TaxID=3634 RepID=A0A2P5YRL7_GOSBA|nr:hypothetical protein GOBAR_AA02332 [Gossypium barbadense]
MGCKIIELLIWVSSVLCFQCFARGFTPADNYLIDCGSLANSTVGGRVFMADDLASKLLSTPQRVVGNTSKSIISSAVSRLYQTARIFTGVSKYTFPISQRGRLWIRLYFNPFVYATYNMSSAKFDVSTENHVLLSSFSVGAHLVKEFSVNITTDSLAIIFTPSENSFAFINALEALETVARVNMGGPMVSFKNDTLHRTWVPDQSFLIEKNLASTVSNTRAVKYVDSGSTPEIAPVSVYGSCTKMNSLGDPNSNFNVTWEFNVDPGFQHLLGNVLAAAYYMDFVTDSATMNKLRVSIGPSNLRGAYPDAILNGLEIMKLNNSDGSLTGLGTANTSGSSSKKKVGAIVGASVGVAFGLLLAGLLFMFCRKRRRVAHRRQSKTWIPFSTNGGTSHTIGSKYSKGTTASLNSNTGYHIPFLAVQEATNNFDESLVIGIGGFGKVYKGELNDGTKVAVKRGNPRSQQGLAEFQTEIEMLSQFRHRHLVSLIGYCDEKNEMILIYEYMENGTLKSHLYGSGHPSLSWKQRLEICIGAARGLHYLHTGYAKAVIHRDVKSANILLDENLMAKVADFGLSKTGPEIDQTHVSTAVKGSFGYLDPEYFRRQQLTEKSDVYSFGVVLFEVLCARPVIDPTLPREMVNLAEWAMKWQKRGQLVQIIDSNLKGKIRPDSLRKFGETAEKCLADFGVDRPSMGDVLWNLEYALQLQEAVENSTNMIGELSPQINNFSQLDPTVSSEQFVLSSVDDLSGASMSKVFSQLVKSEGR